MNHGYEFDAALSKERKAEQERKQKKREARKRLETAAPDLLDACKMMLRLLEGENLDETFDGEAEVLRDAIIRTEMR